MRRIYDPRSGQHFVIHDDLEGQDDGDVVGEAASPFSTGMHGAPWQAGMPPWHLWGNTQTFTLVGVGTGAAAEQVGQTIKVTYKRPETWHWLFYARVQRVTPAPTSFAAGFAVDFDLTVGIGRSAVTIPSFERFNIRWDGATPALNVPINFPIWSTQVIGPARVSGVDGPDPEEPRNIVSQIVAQDIQLTPRVNHDTEYENTLVLDVAAYFSPKTHIRPDWLQVDAVREAMFAGEEIGGK